MKRCYPIVIHKDPDSDFGVTVPDLPGCFSAGSTFEEALTMAREAIEGHLLVREDFGQGVPEPSPVEQHLNDPTFADGIWALVEAELPELTPVAA
ncbi:MAG: putative RNase H-like HicB family nuclease [Verrucomicrobiales bacterium]|jgi:predicted RNase H-like HicB family nuclease